jgi:hypothetical protein
MDMKHIEKKLQEIAKASSFINRLLGRTQRILDKIFSEALKKEDFDIAKLALQCGADINNIEDYCLEEITKKTNKIKYKQAIFLLNNGINHNLFCLDQYDISSLLNVDFKSKKRELLRNRFVKSYTLKMKIKN